MAATMDEGRRGSGSVWPSVLRRVALGAAALLLALQLVPYGWRHENPPDKTVARFPDERSAALWKVACADCHSNRTSWPIWSFVAPISWLVRSDVDAGRKELNVSDWERYDGKADDAADEIEDGTMPPDKYTLLHPDAKLSDEEKQALIDALNAMGEGRG
jgi:hypothetical protein